MNLKLDQKKIIKIFDEDIMQKIHVSTLNLYRINERIVLNNWCTSTIKYIILRYYGNINEATVTIAIVI